MSTPEYKTAFCHNICQRREKSGITLSELAQRSGVSLEILEALDQDEIPEEMMVDNTIDLAKVFGCEPHELFQ